MQSASLERPTSGVSESPNIRECTAYEYVNVSCEICREMLIIIIPMCCIAGDKEKGHPQYVDPPVIPGHEFIGEVLKLGPGGF